LLTGFDATFFPFAKRIDARGANALRDRAIVMTATAGRGLRATGDCAGIDAQDDLARLPQQISGRVNCGAACDRRCDRLGCAEQRRQPFRSPKRVGRLQ